MVDGAAIVDVGSNRVVAASADGSCLVSVVLKRGEGKCWPTCSRFDDVVVVKATPLVCRSIGSTTSPGGMS